MKRMWHIAKKDIFRLRWWVLGWIAVLALPIVHGFILLDRSSVPTSRDATSFGEVQGWFQAFEAVVAYVLAVLLFQEDSVCGSRQFWVTRPIGNVRLLGAKVLTATILLVVLPIAVCLPWWWWCGLSLEHLPLAAAEIAVLAIVVVVPAAAVAVITDSLGRALLWTAVLVAVVLTSVIAFWLMLAANRRPEFIPVAATRGIASIVAVSIGLAMVALLRFILRGRRWPAIAVGATVIVLLLLARRIETPWPSPPDLHDVHPECAAAVQLGTPTFTSVLGGRSGHDAPRVEIDMPLTGVPEHGAVAAVLARQTWSWPNLEMNARGSMFVETNYHGEDLGLHRPLPDAETERWWQDWVQKWKARFPNWPQRWRRPGELVSPHVWLTSYPRLNFTKITAEPTTFHATLWLAVYQPRVAVEAQLASRTWHSGKGVGMRIDHVEPRQPQRSEDLEPRQIATIVTTRPALAANYFTGLGRSSWLAGPNGPSWQSLNRSRGEFGRAELQRSAPGCVVNGVAITWEKVEVGGERIVRDGKWLERPEWMAGASLALIVPTVDSIFHRDVNVSDVKLQVRDERTGKTDSQ